MAKRNEVEVIITADDNASKNIKGIMGSLGDFGLAIDGIKAGIGIVRDMSGGIIDMATNASKLEGVEEAFNGISKAAGKSADEVLASFKKFSAGTISQADAMKSYNTAAQLVGNDFANTLPEAMKYLSKISSATGEDVGYMLDSMVKGVGRLSPMILDNLGIQVNMTEATEAYAKSIGKSADELTKAEQQTALMNQVMEKLAENTAAMPDVAGQVDTKMAAVGATFEDIRYKLGKKLIPILEVGVNVMNFFADAIVSVMDTFDRGGSLIDNVAASFMRIGNLLSSMGLQWLADIFYGIGNAIANAGPLINDFISALSGHGVAGLTDFTQGLFAVKDAVIGVIFERVIPAFQSFLDFLGEAWKIVGPALGKLFDWFMKDALPAIINFIANTVIPVIGVLIGGLTRIWNDVSPFLLNLLDWFINTGLPTIVNFITTTVVPIVDEFINTLRNIWLSVSPALGAIYNWFVTVGMPFVIQAIKDVTAAVFDFLNQNPDLVKAVMLVAGAFLIGTPIVNAFKSGVSLVTGAMDLAKTGADLFRGGLSSSIVQFGVATLAVYALVKAYESLKTVLDQAAQVEQLRNEKITSGAITSAEADKIALNAIEAQIKASQDQGKPLEALGIQVLASLGLFGDTGGAYKNPYEDDPGAFGGSRDIGGPGSAGNLYKIGVPEVYNTPDGSFMFRPGSDGQFTPTDGGETTININFMGPAPTSQQEADNAGYMIVNSMQARGVKL